MHKIKLLFLALVLCLPVSTFAETIVLKSGKTVEGKIIEKTDKYIKIDFQGVPLTYFFDEIENIDGIKVSIQKLSQADIKETQHYLDQGVEAIERNQYEEAISHFNKAINIHPNIAEAFYNRGLAYFRIQRLDNALSDFSKAIEINPNYFEAYNQRGFTNYFKKDFNQAIIDFTNAVKINPNDALAYGGRGTVYLEKSQYQESILDLSRAIELDRNFSEAYVSRAKAYFHTGEYDKSRADVSKVKESGGESYFNPNFLESFKKVARQDSLSNNSVFVEQDILEHRILSINTREFFSDPKVTQLENKGLEFIKQGFWEDGLELMKQAVEEDSDNPLRHMNYGTMLWEKGKIFFERGEKDLANSMFKHSEKELLLAIDLFSKDDRFKDDRFNFIKSNCYFLLGEMYFYPLGDKEEAKSFYEKSLEIYPEHSLALEAMKR